MMAGYDCEVAYALSYEAVIELAIEMYCLSEAYLVVSCDAG